MTNVAVIGFGYWGPNLARNLHQMEESKLVSICDLNPERLAMARRLYPEIKVTADITELLDDTTVDAVVIATPAQSHFELTREFLSAGKHALVEKPLALSSKEVEDLILLAESVNRVLMVGHTFEYNPAVVKIRDLLCEGHIGDVYYIYSTRVNLGRVKKNLNALWSIAPHDVSILLSILGNTPLEVSARGICHLSNRIEDVVFVTLLFPNNILAHIHASWLDPSKVRRMTIVGSDRMVIYDDVASEGKVRIYNKGVLKVGNGQIYGEYQYKLHSGDIFIPKIEMTEPLRNECNHFIDCIQNGKQPLSDGQSGLRVVKVLEAAQRSLENHGSLEVIQ